tara:strand:- start:5260 stop:5478 length:219 start_codon:yes stop_codon:yes gene_type:complete
MKEVKIAIDNIIIHMSNMQRELSRIDSAVASYVEFKGDEKEWPKWLEKKMKEIENERQSTESSVEGNKKAEQ